MLSAAFWASCTCQNTTASTLTGTVSRVSACSALNDEALPRVRHLERRENDDRKHEAPRGRNRQPGRKQQQADQHGDEGQEHRNRVHGCSPMACRAGSRRRFPSATLGEPCPALEGRSARNCPALCRRMALATCAADWSRVSRCCIPTGVSRRGGENRSIDL